MNILIIEDQIDWIQSVVKEAGERAKILSPGDVGLLKELEEGKPVEEQLVELLSEIITRESIALVLLDTDLSRAKGELQAQSSYRVALQELGVPVCQYQKGATQTKFASWQRLQRIAADGASAIWIPKALVNGERFDELVPWLLQMAEGFADLTEKLLEHSDWLSDRSPSEVLALALARPDAKADFLGYSLQNFFFFAAPSIDKCPHERRYATRLGYWLYNYILTFPGPILSIGAAAAFLNLADESFRLDQVLEIVAPCKYSGPFGKEESWYWREDLAQLLDTLDGDIATAPSLKGIGLKRVDPDCPTASAYWCVLSETAILEREVAQNPQWIPPGAYQARVKQEELDELGPLLGI